MSLLDDVSIVVTPNGYKAERLYAVIPTNALGSEKITGFTNGTTYPFDTFTTSGNNITSAIVSSAFAGAVSNSISVTSGEIYKVTFDYTKNSGDDLRVVFSSSVNGAGTQISNNELISASGTYTKYFTITSTTTGYLQMGTGSGSDSLNASISNVSVKKDTGADMDVTRATAATRVDENGLVNYAEVLGSELVTDGGFPTGTTAWSVGSAWSISDGSADYDDTAINSITQNLNLSSGKSYKIQFEITDSTGTGARMKFGNSPDSIVFFNYEYYTNGEHSLYYNATSNSTDFNIKGHTSGSIFKLKNLSVKEVDLNNVPRIDYTGGGCPHILSEPQRTNLYTYSEDFLQSYWTKLNCTAPLTSELAPDGTTNSVHNLNGTSANLFASGGATGVEHTISFYIKSNGQSKDYFRLRLGNNTSVEYVATNDWIRYEFTSTPTTGVFGITTSSSPNNEFDLLVWGAQSEQASYPTSYIPTSGSTVTRNQDQFTRDGIASLINSTEGVLFAEMAALDNDLTTRMISLSDGGNSNRIHMFYHSVSNEIAVNYRVSGTTESSIAFVVSNITNFNKIAFKWKSADFSLWINGVEVGTDSNTTMLPADTLNTLAFEQGNGGNNLYAKVKQLQVYDTALTDNQLIQLTGEAGTHFFESYSEMAETLTYTIQ